MRGGEVAGVARVDNLRADLLHREHVCERHRAALERRVQRRPLLGVEDGVVCEIGRRLGLIRGHDVDE